MFAECVQTISSKSSFLSAKGSLISLVWEWTRAKSKAHTIAKTEATHPHSGVHGTHALSRTPTEAKYLIFFPEISRVFHDFFRKDSRSIPEMFQKCSGKFPGCVRMLFGTFQEQIRSTSGKKHRKQSGNVSGHFTQFFRKFPDTFRKFS